MKLQVTNGLKRLKFQTLVYSDLYFFAFIFSCPFQIFSSFAGAVSQVPIVEYSMPNGNGRLKGGAFNYFEPGHTGINPPGQASKIARWTCSGGRGCSGLPPPPYLLEGVPGPTPPPPSRSSMPVPGRTIPIFLGEGEFGKRMLRYDA
jgi:hypothetical protein